MYVRGEGVLMTQPSGYTATVHVPLLLVEGGDRVNGFYVDGEEGISWVHLLC